MSEAKLIGGSESDRKEVLAQQEAYLEANSKFDWETLRDKLWSGAPEAMFFNLNGHTYNGRDHWVKLWQYYKQQMTTGEWIPYDIGGVSVRKCGHLVPSQDQVALGRQGPAPG